MHDMGALISTEEPARSVSGVEALLAKHNEQKAEIEAREDSVAQVTKVGRRQIQQGHYASTEVSERFYEQAPACLPHGGVSYECKTILKLESY